ncbi:DUF979 domain-containing protein [Dokdonella sp.]|uniref:DUF979 domain-containing protein n=1 Tax=Dokdonella sp. TaxID=2291710 RepID=UPI001AFFC95A|nr:DUF979 domain-containing protein [Dokdonella sp.]MBO9662631.1 DUF979 domain-containing protein [Dokdonella sp.]
MISVEHIYWLVGAFLLVAAIMNARERRWSMAAFWFVLSGAFLLGDLVQLATAEGVRWPAQAMGLGVIALGLLAASGTMQSKTSSEEQRRESAQRLGNRLFAPALAIPLVTLAIVLGAPYLRWGNASLIDGAHVTLASLGIACLVALAFALRTTRSTVPQSLAQGRRLLDTLGCVALLPMLLATLGSVFAATGVGDAIADLVEMLIPIDSRLACLTAFAFGMVLFTVIMGNAFAAFPVMMAGIGLPLLVLKHGAEPAVLGAIGMLTGYCGTLLTPMAANFNIVPAVLLELPDQYGVIRAQVPTALLLLAVNFALLWYLAFR